LTSTEVGDLGHFGDGGYRLRSLLLLRHPAALLGLFFFFSPVSGHRVLEDPGHERLSFRPGALLRYGHLCREPAPDLLPGLLLLPGEPRGLPQEVEPFQGRARLLGEPSVMSSSMTGGGPRPRESPPRTARKAPPGSRPSPFPRAAGSARARAPGERGSGFPPRCPPAPRAWRPAPRGPPSPPKGAVAHFGVQNGLARLGKPREDGLVSAQPAPPSEPHNTSRVELSHHEVNP
jgi:hypothetical protein